MKEKIAEEILTNPDYLTGCRSIAVNQSYGDDLRSEVVAELMTKTDQQLSEIKNIRWYFFAIAYRMWNSPTHEFYRKYRRSITSSMAESYVSDMTENYNINYDYKYNRCKKIIKQTIEKPKTQDEFYQAKLFEMWMELESYRAVSKEVGIPTMAVFEGVKNFKRHVKKLVKW